jgi:hypothetical protein
MQRPGLERSTTLGTMTDLSGSFGLRVIHEQPGKVRVERSGPNSSVLQVDESGRAGSSKGNVLEIELDLIESLTADSPETLLVDLAEGAGGRFLGSGFRATDDRTRNYRGPLHDVFDLFTAAGFRPNQPRRHKRYYFDGATGLLTSVRYLQSQTPVETRYSGWEDRGGEKVPAVVQRFENGQQVFSFRSTVTVFEGKKADGIFARP